MLLAPLRLLESGEVARYACERAFPSRRLAGEGEFRDENDVIRAREHVSLIGAERRCLYISSIGAEHLRYTLASKEVAEPRQFACFHILACLHMQGYFERAFLAAALASLSRSNIFLCHLK